MNTRSEQFRVQVTKDHLVFSAAHFITIGPDFCERLHGHNWRVAAEVAGKLDENGFVFDFIALRDELQTLVNTLDHRMLLPTLHEKIHVATHDEETHVTFDSRRWIFPREECVLLPIQQTTAELIAQWLANKLCERLSAQISQLTELIVRVEENFGQWASYELRL